MKRLILSLVTVFCGLTILAAPLPVVAKDNWVSVRSKNFLLVGSAGEKEMRQVALRLEQFREALSRLFSNFKLSSPVPTIVVVFKSDVSYQPFKVSENNVGFFQPGLDVNYITMTTETKGDQDQLNVIFHEYTHLLINNNGYNMPAWFDEGLAEVYSTFSIVDDRKVVIGKPIVSHALLLRGKRVLPLPLRTLFQVDHQSPYYHERDKQTAFYAESWALMHYLVLGRGGARAPQVSKFVQLLSANVSIDQAFRQAFEMSFEQMEVELQEYISADRYPSISSFLDEKLSVDRSMQSAPVSEAEVQAYLGDLLFHSNRPDAEIYLQKALALNPDLAMAHASLGLLRVKEGKADQARGSLERAAAANSQNYLIHYYYAYALSREGVNDVQLLTSFAPGTVEKMRSELKKAIELRPDYPESYSLLAFVNLVAGSELDETVALLKRALIISPSRNDLVYMLAQVYLHQGNFDDARAQLERIVADNVEAELRQRAQSLMVQVGIRERQARYRLAQSASGTETEMTEGLEPPPSLHDVLRKPRAGEMQVQGTLVRVDCDGNGITFVVAVGERELKLKTASFRKVNLKSFSVDAGREITCGARKPENNVVVSYEPASGALPKVDGEAKSLEFVPKEFNLHP